MKKYLKMFMVALLIVPVVTVFAACGKGGKNSSTETGDNMKKGHYTFSEIQINGKTVKMPKMPAGFTMESMDLMDYHMDMLNYSYYTDEELDVEFSKYFVGGWEAVNNGGLELTGTVPGKVGTPVLKPSADRPKKETGTDEETGISYEKIKAYVSYAVSWLCGECGGDGEVFVVDSWVACEECDGEGYIYEEGMAFEWVYKPSSDAPTAPTKHKDDAVKKPTEQCGGVDCEKCEGSRLICEECDGGYIACTDKDCLYGFVPCKGVDGEGCEGTADEECDQCGGVDLLVRHNGYLEAICWTGHSFDGWRSTDCKNCANLGAGRYVVEECDFALCAKEGIMAGIIVCTDPDCVNGEIVCRYDDGAGCNNGYIDCDDCSATGFIDCPEEPCTGAAGCPGCKTGAGFFVCPACEGDGEVLCPYCAGTVGDTCPTCDGENGNDCLNCNGKALVYVVCDAEDCVGGMTKITCGETCEFQTRTNHWQAYGRNQAEWAAYDFAVEEYNYAVSRYNEANAYYAKYQPLWAAFDKYALENAIKVKYDYITYMNSVTVALVKQGFFTDGSDVASKNSYTKGLTKFCMIMEEDIAFNVGGDMINVLWGGTWNSFEGCNYKVIGDEILFAQASFVIDNGNRILDEYEMIDWRFDGTSGPAITFTYENGNIVADFTDYLGFKSVELGDMYSVSELKAVFKR